MKKVERTGIADRRRGFWSRREGDMRGMGSELRQSLRSRSPSSSPSASSFRSDIEADTYYDNLENLRPSRRETFLLRLRTFLRKKRKLHPRTIHISSGAATDENGKPLRSEKRLFRRQGNWRTFRHGGENALCNQKYSILSFLPKVLYEQFSMFYNLFYLCIAISQFIPPLRVGFVWTYIGPLSFVVAASMAKEASDELMRYRRDREINNHEYTLLVRSEDALREYAEEIPAMKAQGFAKKVKVRSRDIRVGDVLVLDCDQRIPADCVLLKAVTKDGSSESLFVRTDQLDGETDWKIRRAVHTSQKLPTEADLLYTADTVYAEAPKKEIYDFIGNYNSENGEVEPLSLENTIWANMVIASGTAIAVVVYAGRESRAVLNTSQPHSKVGLLDLEVNFMSKLLFTLLLCFSITLASLRGFYSNWWVYFLRYFLLLSYIIPLAMRVNLDMARLLYTYMIQHDYAKMPNCVVRSTDFPEELGRIEFLLSDKTGTLTQNEMEFKKLHIGSAMYGRDTLDELLSSARAAFENESAGPSRKPRAGNDSYGEKRVRLAGVNPRRRTEDKLREALLAVAVAHNVTPAEEHGQRTMQASSPDEIALVKFVESVGFFLLERSQTTIRLQTPVGTELKYEVLYEFPFTSEAKRMGVIVRQSGSGHIEFFLKGADSVMSPIVRYNDWLDEECGNLAREGLRTLVYAHRRLSEDDLKAFSELWVDARTQRHNRKEAMTAAQSSLEREMDLVGLTGVEDKLQPNVREVLEKLRHAGIRIWMLTGDKVETAMCIAVSSRLAERTQRFFLIVNVTSRSDAQRKLSSLRRSGEDDVIVIDGTSLQVMLDNFASEFVELACRAPAAVACRCSPTQKAAIARLLQTHTGKRIAAVGDGGNDVSMIQQANVGLGIPGKEGKQASLAADFSISTFSHLTRLLLWHGRNSYKRSARLAQFIMHRGLIIAVVQIVHCALFFYAAVSVYNSWIQVGYATVFTMLPVFSLVLDEDVSEWVADTYPELYRELRKGRSLNLKSFLVWVFKSIYQGMAIMVISVYVLWDDHYFTTLHISAISFTALVFTELLMVASEVHTWHWLMIVAEAISMTFYFAAVIFLKEVFDPTVIWSWHYLLRVTVVILVSCLPVTIGKCLVRRFAPSPYSKLA